MLLATKNGLVRAQLEQDNWRVTQRYLNDQSITCVASQHGIILAGTPNGLNRSADNGENWQSDLAGLNDLHVRWLAVDPQNAERWFVGTEPAGVFTSQDNGVTWTGCPEIVALRDTYHWWLPYSPEAGCVRDFAFGDGLIYAAVEVGGVLISEDNGDSWQLAKGGDGKPSFASPPLGLVHPDVHSLETDPSQESLLYAATGGGLYRSPDQGTSWEFLHNSYIRAVWINSKNSSHLIGGPSDGVGRNGRIEESHDGGQTWQSISTELDTPWPNNMPERFVQIDNQLFCILDNGQIIAADLKTLAWAYILPDVTEITALTADSI